MLADAGAASSHQANPISSSSASTELDTGLVCLLILARFHDLPADGAQLRHRFAQSGKALSDTELLRAAKHLGLKAGVVRTTWSQLQGIPLPAMVKRRDGRYVVLAKVEGEKTLVQDPVEARPLVLSHEQFEAMWTGEVLLFTKRANIRLQDLKFDFT